MRTALLTLLLVIACQAAHAATAYEALRAVGKQRGTAVIDKVTEVRGEKGAPQPRNWKIVVKDAAARSGATEFDVQGTKLLGSKSLPTRPAGIVMDMGRLNVDSDGAHQIAEDEAKSAGFAYDHADYTLRATGGDGSPTWEVRLVDVRSGTVATISLAAATGKIVSSEGFRNRRNNTVTPPPPVRPPVVADQRPPVNAVPGRVVTQPPPDTRAPLGPRVNKFFDRVGRHLGRRGRQVGDLIHNAFSSEKRNTAGPHGSSGSGQPGPARNPADEDTVTPTRVRD